MKKSPSTKRGVGRPTLFTPENREKILTAVKLGAGEMICGQSAGVAYRTIRGWVERGEKEGEGEYWQFTQDLQKAKGERVNRWLARIEKAAETSWQAAAWKLERLYTDIYGRTVQRIEHTDKDGKNLPKPENNVTVNIDLSELNAEELRAYRGIMAKLAARGRAGANQSGQAAPPVLPV